MRIVDNILFSVASIRSNRIRTGLMLTAMGIGVAAVVLLTSLGEGARRYVSGEFASLGTHLVIVLPGKSETSGLGLSIMVGTTPRDLTIDDAMALKRHSLIKRIAPIIVGAAPISWQRRDREVVVLGSTTELIHIRHLQMAQGRFLPKGDADRAQPVCVIGAKIRDEIFGIKPGLGEWMRIGDRRCRVIGIMATEGRSIGMDIEDVVIVPVASAQVLLNTPSLFRILVQAKTRDALPIVKQYIIDTIKTRHQGEEDITVITQDAVLDTFDKIFSALTLTVAGIGAISLAVAGILIMNVMLISVSQRTMEIGLLKALGAHNKNIMTLFLIESILLSSLGALIGLIVGNIGSWVIGRLYPTIPMGAPLWAIVSALGVAIITGLVFGVLPARRAATLDPVQALSRR